jgi:uncharacterized RmlC-like cupin family protein
MHPIEARSITALAPGDLAAGATTPGLTRELAFDTERAMLLRVQAEGGVASGWHHHGDREVLGHLLRGTARFEFGPGGRESTEVVAGGFFHIPAGLVHRDLNPADEPQEMVISFVGTGPLVVNVDGPDPA